MNKRCYRVVFNHSRQMMMVVSELAKNHSADNARAPRRVDTRKLTAVISPLRLTMMLLLGWIALPASAGGIVADGAAPGNRQPSVLSSANGTPQVNIQTPNRDGVSRNQYRQFDIDRKGAILNNSAIHTQTQLGGMITANPWLAKGEAKIILNEVNSANASQLNGFIEVAGKRADVIIANPAGITCNGCGFINAGQTTMAAAQTLLEQGRVAGFEVDRGQIAIGGGGMNDVQSDHTRLIGRAVEVNAKLHAQELTITTGHNITDAQGNVVRQKQRAGDAPAFALDVAAVGGMYSDKIKLVGTEHGVGVRNAGIIGAQVGELSLSADGQLQNSGILTAAADVKVTLTDSFTNAGTVSAGRDIQLKTAGDMDNRKQLVAGRHITSDSRALSNASGAVMAAGVDHDGRLTQRGDLVLNAANAAALNGLQLAQDRIAVSAQDLSLQGSRSAADAVTLRAATRLELHNATVTAADTLTAVAPDGIDNHSGRLSAGALTLSSRRLDNTQGQIIQFGAEDLALTHENGIINNGGTIAANGRDLTLNADRIDNRGGRIQHAGDGAVRIATADFSGQEGAIRSNGSLIMKGGSYQLDNSETSARSISAQIQSLSHRAATLIQRDSGALTLAVQHTLDNAQGIIAGQHVTLRADALNNQRGKIQGSATTQLTVTEKTDNHGGEIRAGRQLSVSTRALDNAQGIVAGDEEARLTTEHLTNTQGTLRAGQALAITSGTISGDGSLLSSGDMALTLNDRFINQHNVQADGSLLIAAHQGIQNDARIQGGNALTLETPWLINTRNAEISADQATLNVRNTLTNTGLIDGIKTQINAGTLNNTASGRLYGDDIALQAALINNTAAADNARSAVIAARSSLNIGSATLNNAGESLIYSQGPLNIGRSLDANGRATGSAERFNNMGATLESQGNMTLSIGEINNINTNLVTQVAEISRQQRHEGVLKGHTQRFDWKDIDISHKNKYGVHSAVMPDGSRDEAFYEYRYTRVIQETQVITTEPGIIQSAMTLTINGDKLVNQDSRVMAGDLLIATINDLQNSATPGVHIVTDAGTQTRWWAKKKKRPIGGTKTSQGKESSDYSPPPQTTSIDLAVQKWEANAQTDVQTRASAGRTPLAITTVPLVSATDSAPVEAVIRTANPPLTLPKNNLFRVQPGSDSQYLVETDPRFTNHKKWLATDYMQQAMLGDHQQAHKRLGDGYYEQRLVSEQIVKLAGQRYLGDYRSDEAQFQALMDNGITFGQTFNLTLGTALTAEQMTLLTSDIVWLVEQTVTLADGSSETVLVPQVYARLKPGDLGADGALLSGKNTQFTVNDQLMNSGSMLSQEAPRVNAGDILNLGTIRSNDLLLSAQRSLSNIGGTLIGGRALTMNAENIHSETTLTEAADSRHLNRVAGVYIQHDAGRLTMNATDSVTLAASDIQNRGQDAKTVITAGGDITLATVTTTRTENGDWGADNYRRLSEQADVGTQLIGGSIALNAGRDITATAATVAADSALTAAAGRDITLNAGTVATDLVEHSRQHSKGLLSASSLETHDEVQRQRAASSQLSGHTVTLRAGDNLTTEGSQVIADGDLSVRAGKNITVTTADEMRNEAHLRAEKNSGLMGSGGIGFTIGTRSLTQTTDSHSQQHQGSTLGSTGGDVTLSAGENLTLHGSDVIAQKDINLTGQSVTISAAENTHTELTKTEQKQSGLTLALSGTVGSALNAAVQTANQAKETDDSRIKALQSIKAGLSAVQAAGGARLADASQGESGASIGINLSFGSSTAKSETETRQTTAQSSGVSAGNNLTVSATGKAPDSGNIAVTGSALQAGGDIALDAQHDITLLSAQNTQTVDGKNSSQGSSVGVGITFGSNGIGFNVNASVNKGKGFEKGNSRYATDTTVNAGNTLTLSSGNDTTLKGAQIQGENVVANVGNNLILRSEQAMDNYEAKQSSFSAGGSIGFGNGSLNIAASRDKMHSDYASVENQTGIFAGKGGFDITVGNHTQLDGAAIASAANQESNRLDTGTLGFTDIDNRAEFKAQHQGFGLSSGGSIGGQFAGNMANSLLAGANNQARARGTTQSAIADGAIVVRDRANQQQDVAGLARDTERAHQPLSPIFDKEKARRRLQQAQLIGEIGNQVADIARTEAEIAGEKAKRDPTALSQARTALAASGKPFTEQDVAQRAYNTGMRDSGLGTGGVYQQAIQAATAAVQGLAGGNLQAALAGGAAPYISEIIKQSTPDGASRVAAHAVVNAALTAAQGNHPLAGAAGAATGEIVGMLATEMYQKPVAELSETEKQTVSALATVAAGLAGGLVGDAGASALAGAQSGKTTVENNLLGGSEWLQTDKAREHAADVLSCRDNPAGEACKRGLAENKAYAAAFAAGSVALLPGSAQAMWGLGAGANAGISYLADGSIDPANAAIAGWVNVISMGNGLAGTVGWNAAGGALGNWIDDKGPLSGALINGAGSGIGYGIGKGLSWGVNAGANWWKGGWDPKFNAELRSVTEVKGELGLSKEMKPSNVPSSIGNIGSSITSEAVGKYTEYKMKQGGNDK
ncbi:hemagglutinin repeat-containing protein [Edwardsiella piscicida]|uniref:two-partner secretion domain-containing protein n=1 Tax=Edwardsiella piscicida TaxID=1263550 RepID=UPI001CECF4CD|nr:hemagglutinin repeat-containing protein [Edwardsiella piscicida]AOP42287.2 hemagglutinin repeat-containing protein [Edwardsiella piscicida]